MSEGIQSFSDIKTYSRFWVEMCSMVGFLEKGLVDKTCNLINERVTFHKDIHNVDRQQDLVDSRKA